MTKDYLKAVNTEFPIYIAEPKSRPKGAIIVIHEIWGLTDHIKNIADRLAEEGYVALAPSLLSDTNIEKVVDDSLARDLFDPEKRTAIQPKLREIMAPVQSPDFAKTAKVKLRVCYEYLLKNYPTKENIAVMGFCFGGTYSFQLAIMEANLKAAIPYYGHAEFSTDELSNIKCPILAFYGEKDERLISTLPNLKEKMKHAKVRFESIVYSDCGHAFFNDSNEFAYNEAAAKNSWKKSIEFLNEHLDI